METALGRQQVGLRHTVRNGLLMDRLVGLWTPYEEVTEELPGTAVRLITSMDGRLWNDHKVNILSENPPAYVGQKTPQ